MRADEFDVDDAKVVVHVNDQTIFVSANIEYHAIVGHKTCMSISAFNCLGISPVGSLRFSKPRLQGLLCIRMAFPKVSERSPGENPHGENDSMFPLREQEIAL